MSSANSLTKALITFIRMNGGHANRINNISRKIKGKFVKSSTDPGVPDIIACIRGTYTGIEVKIGRDSQSPDQKEQQRRIQQSGGRYIIARDIDQAIGEIEPLFRTTLMAVAVGLAVIATACCTCKPQFAPRNKERKQTEQFTQERLAQPIPKAQ